MKAWLPYAPFWTKKHSKTHLWGPHPPGAAQPGVGQDATPHGPAGGQGGTDNREWHSPASLNPDKLAAAQQLKKDNSLWTSVKLTGWKPTKTKPTKTELWQVILGLE